LDELKRGTIIIGFNEGKRIIVVVVVVVVGRRGVSSSEWKPSSAVSDLGFESVVYKSFR